MASIGQVADGTRCSDGSICQGQRCVTLSSLNLPLACPTSNGQQCSGPTRGVSERHGELKRCRDDVIVVVDRFATTVGHALAMLDGREMHAS